MDPAICRRGESHHIRCEIAEKVKSPARISSEVHHRSLRMPDIVQNASAREALASDESPQIHHNLRIFCCCGEKTLPEGRRIVLFRRSEPVCGEKHPLTFLPVKYTSPQKSQNRLLW